MLNYKASSFYITQGIAKNTNNYDAFFEVQFKTEPASKQTVSSLYSVLVIYSYSVLVI